MKTQTFTAQVAITLASGTQPCTIEYDTLESLSSSIFDLTCEDGYVLDNTVVTLPNGKSYKWIEVYAHYCFAHDRISASEFVKLQFSEENAL